MTIYWEDRNCCKPLSVIDIMDNIKYADICIALQIVINETNKNFPHLRLCMFDPAVAITGNDCKGRLLVGIDSVENFDYQFEFLETPDLNCPAYVRAAFGDPIDIYDKSYRFLNFVNDEKHTTENFYRLHHKDYKLLKIFLEEEKNITKTSKVLVNWTPIVDDKGVNCFTYLHLRLRYFIDINRQKLSSVAVNVLDQLAMDAKSLNQCKEKEFLRASVNKPQGPGLRS